MNENTNNATNIETTAEATENKKPETEAAAAEVKPAEEERTFTQSELEAVVEKRLARAEKKYNKMLEEAKKPSEEQVNTEEQIKALQELVSKQNKTILGYEVASYASQYVKPEMLEAFVKLLDLKDIEVDDAGTYKDEIKDLVDEQLKKNAWFKKEEKPAQQGFVKAGAAPQPAVTVASIDDPAMRKIWGLSTKSNN